MKKSLGNRLAKIINLGLNTIDLSLVRTSTYRELSKQKKRSAATQKARMEHVKNLGFSPRVIFDGGAFSGRWAREVSLLFPGAAIVLIEPNVFMQESIKRNISDIQPPPKIINAALGETSGKANLNIWKEEVSDSGASLLGHVRGIPSMVIEVNVDTIDNISQQTTLVPDLLKLDLQGGELAALRGATEVLKLAELVIVEFGCLDAYIGRTTPRDLIEIMYNNNYCLYDVAGLMYRPYDGALTGGDFFFVKNDSVLRNYKDYE